MNYVIKKNKHSSGIRIAPFVGTSIEKEFMFTESCRYEGSTQIEEQVNKLFGIAHLYHHWNSARFGWRYNKVIKNIDIFSYTYRNSFRFINYLRSVEILDLNTYKIEIANGTINFIINGVNHYCEHTNFEKFYGYKLYPYFGGKEVAQHDTTIYERN